MSEPVPPSLEGQAPFRGASGSEGDPWACVSLCELPRVLESRATSAAPCHRGICPSPWRTGGGRSFSLGLKGPSWQTAAGLEVRGRRPLCRDRRQR